MPYKKRRRTAAIARALPQKSIRTCKTPYPKFAGGIDVVLLAIAMQCCEDKWPGAHALLRYTRKRGGA
jgi:hypothetical protein